jgi:hypothetical protein
MQTVWGILKVLASTAIGMAAGLLFAIMIREILRW